MSAFRLYAPHELGGDGYPSEWHGTVKHAVREEVGHRCVRCGHPYLCGKTPGQWSPCDEDCTHGGPLRGIDLDGPGVVVITDADLARERDVAPRLGRARDQWLAEQQRLKAEADRRERQLFRARKLLEHRELQFLRAAASGSRTYARKRSRKLDAAERIMREAEGR